MGDSMVFYKCKVFKAGPAEDGNVYIALKNTDPDSCVCIDGWYVAFHCQEDKMLSVALTAMTLNHQVEVSLTGTDQYSIINRLYLLDS